MKLSKFPVPVLGDEMDVLYADLYGERGAVYLETLRSSPDESGVLSRLLAYLVKKKGA